MIREALITGTVACIATMAVAAAWGRAERGRALPPINAPSHVLWGDDEVGQATRADVRHTLPAVAINEGAAIFWATLYERAFGRAARNGEVARPILGGIVVAALAYLVDYHLVPKRLTPGWEIGMSRRGLAAVFAAMAASFPLRGLVQRAFRSSEA